MRSFVPRPRSARLASLLRLVAFAGASLLLGAPASAAVTTLSYWRMGETENGTPGAFTTSTPDSVGGRTLALAGAPFYSADVGAGAFAGSGSTRSIDLFNNNTTVRGQAALPSTATSSVGIEAWVRAYNTNGVEYIAYSGDPNSNGFGLLRSGNQWRAQLGGQEVFGSAPVAVDTWTHLAIVRQGSVTYLYVNGAQAGQSTFGMLAPAGVFGVGGAPPTFTSGHFDGKIDEVRAFSFDAGQFALRDLLLFGPELSLEQPASVVVAQGGTRDFDFTAMGSPKTLPFSVRNVGPGALALTGLPRVEVLGPNAADFTVTPQPPASVAASAVVYVGNPGFESPVQSVGGATFAPLDGTWTFGAQAGIARNGSPFCAATAPEGTQVAFIQTLGASAAQSFISQAVTFPQGGQWQIRFRAARRAFQNANSLEVRIDNLVLGTVPSNVLDEDLGNDFFRQVVFPYTPALLGTHTLTIAGTRTGGDFTTAIDNVQIVQQGATVGNPGFEAPALAFGTFVQQPPGASWTFTGSSGVVALGRNDAPRLLTRLEGAQSAYLQALATISQTVSLPNVGSHFVRFKIAPDGREPANTIAVKVDGQQIGIVPDNQQATWTEYAFPFENGTVGSHVVQFEGRFGGISLVDDVEILVRPSSVFDVRFAPLAAFARSARLRITSNDTDESPYLVNLAGFGIGPDIVVEQPVGTNVVNNDSRSFGTVQPGNQSQLRFTLGNNGSVPTVDNINATIVGPDASSFLLSRKPATSAGIGVANSTWLVVMFDPLTPGTKNAVLRIASNDGDENPFNVNLTGTLVATPEISVDQPAGAAVADGGARTFPSAPVGGSSTLDFTVLNTGNQPLNLVGAPRVTIDGPNAADFSVTTLPPAQLQPAIALGNAGFEAPYVEATDFDPPVTGLRWTYDSTIGISPDGGGYFTTASQGRQAALIARTNIYGAVASQPITIPGAGSWLLRVDAIRPSAGSSATVRVQVSDPVATSFNLGDIDSAALATTWKTFAFPFTTSVAQGGKLVFSSIESSASSTPVDAVQLAAAGAMQVRFAPGGPGTRTATLHIANDDPDEGSYDIVLNGSGVAGEIAVEQPAGTDIVDGGTKSFGNVETGSNASLTFTVKNTSALATLTGIGPTIDGADAGQFIVMTAPATSLAPGASTTFTVRFEPLAGGGKTAALHIASTDTDENPFDIALQGNGIVSTVEIGLDQPAGSPVADGASRSFPATPIGTPTSLAFSLFNTGNVPLSLPGTPRAQVSGPQAAEFVVTAQPPVTLGAAPTVRNRGFEEPAQLAAGFANAPALGGWTFGATAGVARNGSSLYASPAPQGVQAGFVTTIGTNTATSFLSQPLFFGTGNHVVRFAAVRRSAGANNIDVRIDGTTIGTLPATSLPDDTWRTFSFAYASPSAATRTLTLAGTRTGGDFTTAIDDVQVGTAAQVNVQFTPAATGLRSATLTIPNDDPDESPYDVVLSGTSTGADISVEQPALTVMADGEPRNLGGVVVNDFRITTFTIRNTGTAPLTGLTTSVDGPDPTFFFVTSAPVAPVAPGASTTFDVSFAPNDTRSYSATLHIASNDVDESPFDIPLSGAGFQENLQIEQPAGTPVGASGSISQFGFTVPVGQPRTLNYLLRNTGVGKDLTGITASVSGSDAARFVITTPPASTVAAGGSTPFDITFTPTTNGGRAATLTVTSSDPDENPFFLLLEGTGVTPDISIEQPVGNPLVDGASTRDLGNVAVGANASLTFRVRNSSNGQLTGIQAALTGPDALRFSITTPPPATLNGGAGSNMVVQFTPIGPGPVSATLQVASSDPDENPFDIGLTGTGTAAEIDVEQPAGAPMLDGDARSFGELRVGGSATQTYVVRNSGTGTSLTGVSAAITGAGAAAYSIATAPAATLAPGASTTLVVTYAPVTSGSFDATLAIASNDSDESPFDVVIGGSAIDPEIVVEQPAGSNVVDGATRDFGDVGVGGNASFAFALRNTGTTPLTGVVASLGGPGAGEFTVATPPDTVIAPGATSTLVVRYAPGTVGAHAASLQVASNDADENPFDVAVTGRGVLAEIALEQPAGSALASGEARSFGEIAAGSTAPLTFLLRNTGFAQPLVGVQASITGADASAFSVTSAPAGTLAAGASAAFTVTFAPTAPGTYGATLEIASSDADENPYQVALVGSAIAVLADLQVGKSNGEGTLLPTRDTVYTVQVLNGGPATVPSVRIVDDLPASFSNVQWTCVSQPTGLCPAVSGSGDVDQTTIAPLANGSLLEYAITARPSGAPGTLVTNTASAQILGTAISDSDGSNNTASDTDAIVGDSIFFGGFENSAGLLRPPLRR